MNNQEINKWSEKVQTDENLRALADIKVLMEDYHNIKDSYGIEQDELLEKIEEVCNKVKDKKKSIQGILKNIKEYYEEIGRGNFKNNLLLLKLIDVTISSVGIPSNYLVISRLKNEQLQKNE